LFHLQRLFSARKKAAAVLTATFYRWESAVGIPLRSMFIAKAFYWVPPPAEPEVSVNNKNGRFERTVRF